MSCPRCREPIHSGNQRCHCGAYYYHEWSGGGALIGSTGSWVYRSADASWEPVRGQTVVGNEVGLPILTEGSERPVVQRYQAGSLREIVVPVVIQIQF